MSGGIHCYPGTEVLKNKYNIRDKELLEKLEIQKVAAKILGLDIKPDRVKCTCDITHLINIHKYLFEDLYEWAGTFRRENLYKSERVLSGGSAEYADYKEIESKLNALFNQYKGYAWEKTENIGCVVADLLLQLWSIHPFREGNTRTCITFLWHYLNGMGVEFRVELLRNSPSYVRDSLVMANYDQKEYLYKIISDALRSEGKKLLSQENATSIEQYQIAKSDYEAFREKYSIEKNFKGELI